MASNETALISARAVNVCPELIDRGPRRRIEPPESLAPCAVAGSFRHCNRTELRPPRIEDADRITVSSPDIAFLVRLESVGSSFCGQAPIFQRTVAGNV